ncbi:MAG TPA: ATP synthase F1 subunit delta [Candidatus Binatia bacterium]|nr:ATP synthase F1 subunit delta [Candidatus Binatia bacterium]
MIGGSIARRYARALFELARETDEVEGTAPSLAVLAQAVEQQEPGTLAPGLLTREQRQSLAGALSKQVSPLLGRFLAIVAENDRLEHLPRIHEWFQRLQDEAADRVRVRVRSAARLSAEQIDAIRTRFQKVTGHGVLTETEVDPALIGGVTVEAEGKVYDGSVRTQLQRLERLMAGQG